MAKLFKNKRKFGIVVSLVVVALLGFSYMAMRNLGGNGDALLRIRGRDGAVEVAQQVLDSLKSVGVESIPSKALADTTFNVQSYATMDAPHQVFTDKDILVGEDTNDYLVKYYKNCIYEVKRLIGIDFSKEKESKDEIAHLPFKVIIADKNSPSIKVEGKKDLFSPAEISSSLLPAKP